MSENELIATTARKRALFAVAAGLLGILAALCWLSPSGLSLKGHLGTQQARVPPQSISVGADATGVPMRSLETPASLPEFKAGRVAIIGENGTVTVADIDSAELQKRLAWANSVHRLDGRP